MGRVEHLSLLPKLVCHASGLQRGDPWWLAWQADPIVVLSLLVVTLAYACGLIRLWNRSAMGQVVSSRRAGAFFSGTLVLAIALLSPVDALGNDLAWVHMTQHMLLSVVAAPLMMFGLPGLVALWACPLAIRKRCATRGLLGRFCYSLNRVLWNPLFAWLVYALGLWVWHLPIFYQAALQDQMIHDGEHLTFFLTACLFWRQVVDSRGRRRLPPELSVVYLFSTSMHAMFLGVFMALSPALWYPIYEGRTLPWGISALQDQQLAGAIMWMPACTSYAVIAAFAFLELIHREEMQPERALASQPTH